ncbi:MAG: hypothetical protein J6S44_05335, partial [Clostridia bacterium]|nr:hypothetical protein [Clostridia bacterium]
MKKAGKRLVCFLLILCCLMQVVVFSPVSALNTAEKSAGAAVHYGSFAIDGISIDYESTLRALEDGRYYLSLTVLSTPIEMELNTHVRTAESGTYRISKSGWYLIELWGADGADGSDTTASGGSEGGRGGAGGHMYAEVYLEKDQVLFYTLGGDGVPAHVSGEGGGINGDGGHHGSSGGDTVGGGGGYSALFLFEPGELQNKYGTRFIDAIDETDRTTRYFMIAGGGGGGGAGNGSSLLGSAAVGRADGGAGGSVVGSATGVISGAGIVSGTFYAGENGKSSGTSLDYIGRGGTNLPGRLPKTWITGVSGTEPNDWAASAHPGMAGGAGGSGNLRGGGGGAGFNGGSGGVMTGTIIPSNVGGGGGGSSFLASELNGHSVTTTLSARAQACLQTSGNPSETGGALCLTYLEEVDSSFLDNVSMTMTFSPYFVPTEGGLYDEDGNPLLGEEYYDHDSDESAYKLTVKNVSLLTDGDKAGGKFTVGLYLKTINGFAGGNNVPIFADYATFVATAVPEEVRQIDFGKNCGYVNVPLRFPITTHSYKAGEPGEKFFVRDLYTDDYATLRDNLRGDVRYDFISSIGEMTLTDPDTGTALPLYDGEGNPVAVYPQRTTRYRVTLPVTVKDVGVAPIGTPNLVTTQVTAWSTVDVMTSVSDSLGDYEVTYTKDVKDNGDGSYTLSMNVQSSVGSMGEIVPDEGTNHHQSYSAGADGFEHPIAVTGYYLIRLWAGNGGTGANSLLAFITQGYGGAGGAGGYVDAWVHLERGWYIKGLIGKNGGSGSSNDGGTGGGYTYMQLLDENKQVIGMLAVAAGGGGGGGAYWTSDGKAGETPAATDSVYTGNLADYNGGKGKHGNNGSPKGGAGASHNNFLATVLTTGEKEIRLYSVTDTTAINNLLTKDTAKLNLEHALGTPDSDHVSDTGGGVGIHFLMSDRDDESLGMEYDKVFSEYTVALPISPYFEVQSVLGWDNVTRSELSYDDGYGIVDDFFTLPNGTKLNNGVTIPVYVEGETSLVYFANINPSCLKETVEEGHEHQHVHISIDYTLSVTVIPAEGFFGGNDVPLYDGAAMLYHRQYHTNAQTGNMDNEVKQLALQENYVTDYVNVAVPKAEFTLTGNDVYYDGTPIL